MSKQLTEKDWKAIEKALNSCIYCLSTKHSSKDCPYKDRYKKIRRVI